MERAVRVVAQVPPSLQGVLILPPPLQMVAERTTTKEIVEAVQQWQPHVVLLVVGPDYESTAVSFLVRQADAPVVCLLLDGRPHRMREALVAGAVEALIWPDELEVLPSVLVEAASRVVQPVATAPSVSIAVYGAKGGVGTTRVATELALALRQAGHPTLLADVGASESGPLSLLGQAYERSLDDLLAVADELTMEQVQKVAMPHSSGLLIASSAHSVWQTDTLRTMVTACRRLFPVTVWDVPTEAYSLLAAAESAFSHILCVTTADAHAIHPLKRRVLPTWANNRLLSRIQLVVNRQTPDSLLRGPDIAAQLHLPLAGEIDELPGLAAASGTAATALTIGARRQTNRTAQQIERLARSLCPKRYEG